ncbi:RNA polymerase sigma factor [Engelhardtia mirabilis]|uniref:ECF RNA polymerase sigma-E factor n=1 Tax=Engelhardtia mirabilis TaxID=2528011 RepID=A0A518BEX6_9BACT|nr:ECF RNA polymerase sigma-E factor [Planctomycetes bacterium Pla133]QDU99838.1 ECF RNA polymerase sigma-E factor [Planctomycetes bacterium Pla86]
MPLANDLNDPLALAPLLASWTTGDVAAGTAAIDAARPWLHRRLERLGARAGSRTIDVDDLLQESCVAAHRGLSGATFRGPAEFLAWLSTIAVNKYRDRMRARSREPIDEVSAEDVLAIGPEGERVATHAVESHLEAWRRLCQRTEDVPDGPRRVLVMRRGLGVEWDVTSFVSGRMVAATRSLYYRSRSTLGY